MEKSKQKKRNISIACISLAAVIAVFGVIYLLTAAKPQEGGKTISVTVVHKDKSEKAFTVKTDAENLEQALLQDQIVRGDDGPYGLYITEADGEKADEGNQEWWCVTKGGAAVNTSAASTIIADGDKYELTLTVGY